MNRQHISINEILLSFTSHFQQLCEHTNSYGYDFNIPGIQKDSFYCDLQIKKTVLKTNQPITITQ